RPSVSTLDASCGEACSTIVTAPTMNGSYPEAFSCLPNEPRQRRAPLLTAVDARAVRVHCTRLLEGHLSSRHRTPNKTTRFRTDEARRPDQHGRCNHALRQTRGD